MKKYFCIVLAGVILSLFGCGKFDLISAKVTGYSSQCVDGVQYLQFSSGASVAYNPNGTIKTCK